MAYFSPHRLLPLTSKAPKCPKPKIPEVSLSFFTSAFIPCDPRHSNPNPTSLGESSLHHFYMNAKASNLVSRSGFMRRDVLLGTLLGATSFPFVAFGSLAESGWSVGAGETNRIKSVTAFYPKEVSNSNVSVTIVGVGPDFTGLGSFGKVDAFAETLVNGLDRSWQRPPGVAAKLINSAAANGLYYIEYTLQNPGERLRHIFSAIGIASNGWYNRLYTVTGQVQLFYPTQLDSFDHDQSLGSFLHGF
ncbi:psbP domain-containing protein 3, chloroplastic isoform X5 [Dendrobium catenatum]|uniref:psbP domain-containing protein 3, chloroplastic isoform X5 n=1 Tax=Dendrobium catenatum TaxID=906689 RepID=UPI0009F2D0C9|nr:psbP domain-containing protein 3, chloroplastic isoform X5 [Dendrobium catenatum]